MGNEKDFSLESVVVDERVKKSDQPKSVIYRNNLHTVDNFMEFLETRYNKPKTDYDYIDVRAWLINSNFDGDRFRAMYDILSENYEYNSFPKLPTLKSLWREHSGDHNVAPPEYDYEGEAMRNIEGKGIEELHKWSRLLRSKLGAGHALTMPQKAFLHKYDTLFYIYSVLRDQQGWEPVRVNAYCEKLRTEVDAGRSLLYEKIGDPIPMPVPATKSE
ncbi:MAG TPA: hypothetical protein PKM65_20510 [Spirochaetota bacterium]|nr:hypothetical protein [Spirochaetota bacterium]